MISSLKPLLQYILGKYGALCTIPEGEEEVRRDTKGFEDDMRKIGNF